MKNQDLEQKNQALEQELANTKKQFPSGINAVITECENTNSMLRKYIESQNSKDCGNSGNNAESKVVGTEVCTLGIPDAIDCNISNEQKASKGCRQCERIWNHPNHLISHEEILLNPCLKSHPCFKSLREILRELYTLNTQDTVLRDIKKGACPLDVLKSVDSTVRQINDIIKLKTALPTLGPKFDYEPERPCTTKFLNFLHTLNDKMATVSM